MTKQKFIRFNSKFFLYILTFHHSLLKFIRIYQFEYLNLKDLACLMLFMNQEPKHFMPLSEIFHYPFLLNFKTHFNFKIYPNNSLLISTKIILHSNYFFHSYILLLSNFSFHFNFNFVNFIYRNYYMHSFLCLIHLIYTINLYFWQEHQQNLKGLPRLV